MTTVKHIQPVIIAVIKKDNKYLLTQRAQIDAEDLPEFIGKWELPGGGLEKGETPEEALHREVREELGIAITTDTKFPYIFTKIRGTWQGLFMCYECETEAAVDGIILNEESSAYCWATQEEIQNLETLPGVVETILAFAEK